MLFWMLMIALLIAAIGALVLGDAGTIGGFDGGTIASVAAMAALLIYLGHYTLRDYAGRITTAFRDFAIWIAIALVLVIGYSFRDEAEMIYRRVAAELLPPGTVLSPLSQNIGERAVRIRKRLDGHFAVQSTINGRIITMLVDTGASTIVLTPSDASAAGIATGALDFSVPIQTANGTAFAAAIRIDRIAVGPIEMRGLDALVARPGALGESLLGMNFLRELRDFQFSGDFLTLRG